VTGVRRGRRGGGGGGGGGGRPVTAIITRTSTLPIADATSILSQRVRAPANAATYGDWSAIGRALIRRFTTVV
jgi:hypothetical protein